MFMRMSRGLGDLIPLTKPAPTEEVDAAVTLV